MNGRANGGRQGSLYRAGLVTSVLLAAVIGSPVGAQNVAEETAVYRLGPKDLVEVQVIEEPSLNLERRVTDSGSLILPLVGELGVAGLTPMEAADLLTERLEASFLQRATVTMRVVEFRSRPISVIGAVRRPGNLELSGRWNLLDALTDAGGLAEGHGEVVNILRRASNGLHDQLTISLDDLLIRADPTVNIPIFSNDVISVPSAAPITVYLMGEVGTTGAMTFRANQRPTLLTAIAQAGGLTKRAASKISVKRQRDDGSRHEIVVRYKRLLSGEQEDLPLEDGDLIVVKESFL
jgi:polysaccharide export outer membrane protein